MMKTLKFPVGATTILLRFLVYSHALIMNLGTQLVHSLLPLCHGRQFCLHLQLPASRYHLLNKANSTFGILRVNMKDKDILFVHLLCFTDPCTKVQVR